MPEQETLHRIILIDDEPDILEIASLCLETVGKIRVSARSSARGIVEFIDRIRPDLILLDVMMPEIDGPTALTHMRADPRFDHIPIVFMTARIQPEEVREYIEMGAIGVVGKPFDPMGISDELKRLWSESRASGSVALSAVG
ncbi:response regulator [Rhizobium halophytocola]|uniref:CheY-like chemotaxis protein n=1 Tax=Rhizobium halophytocola TaxID=735519 RepID=A0ABS4E6K0_9HYPH|nr:response regulator [Rhizobium halophytocola]MBP1853551.1 CheY-like chemotaxis protein [Rhizobium halophytocola]